ncbi:HDOD domain-containing protein [Stratiformator vulcanicus]|uniref:HDOD domain protein n=1 Tax=Stratiformator vulcanicus TaxID=2527980 RepID=A0A517R7M1_9PLAN|nr:HDOD domain-containing protein [Stratiformator vulcanicus]QDT39889.1 HDOD domain protein [Stratiformator vulcanicus]
MVATTSKPTGAERFALALGELQASDDVTRKLISLTATPDYRMDQVVACLERDPALSLRILRVVNSSRYGLRHKVGSVKQAAALLGQNSLRLFALSFSVIGGLMKGPLHDFYGDYWRRAATTATAAAHLVDANADGYDISTDDAYTAGVLADIGVLVLAQYAPKSYVPAYESCVHGPELISAERELFKIDHPALGATFLSAWDLPSPVVDAVARHHAGSSDSVEMNELETVLRTAGSVAQAIVDPGVDRFAALSVTLEQDFPTIDPLVLVEQVYDEVAREGSDAETETTRCEKLPPKDQVVGQYAAA